LPSADVSRRLKWLSDNGGLGMSVRLRFRSSWVHVDPDDWPYRLDCCTHVSRIVEEVSATPTPLFRSTFGTVRVY
jgi:hypothetical protein